MDAMFPLSLHFYCYYYYYDGLLFEAAIIFLPTLWKPSSLTDHMPGSHIPSHVLQRWGWKALAGRPLWVHPDEVQWVLRCVLTRLDFSDLHVTLEITKLSWLTDTTPYLLPNVIGSRYVMVTLCSCLKVTLNYQSTEKITESERVFVNEVHFVVWTLHHYYCT